MRNAMKSETKPEGLLKVVQESPLIEAMRKKRENMAENRGIDVKPKNEKQIMEDKDKWDTI